MGLPEVLTELVSVLSAITGLATVVEAPPEGDPDESALPIVIPIVRAPSTMDGTFDRRTLLWPVDLVCLICKRGHDIAADLALVYPWPERIIGALDDHLTLNQTIDGVIGYETPVMDDPGVIGWRQQTYVGFTLLTLLPIRTDVDYRA